MAIRLFVVIWFQWFSGNWFMDELKGLLTEILQELRRIRYANSPSVIHPVTLTVVMIDRPINAKTPGLGPTVGTGTS